MPGGASTTMAKRARVSCMSDWTSAAESNVVEVVNELPDANCTVNQNTYVYDGCRNCDGVVGEVIPFTGTMPKTNSISAPTATNGNRFSLRRDKKIKQQDVLAALVLC